MKKILVVDDNPVDRHLVGSLLSQVNDWQVEFASNGELALQAIEQSEPDLVVTDLQMPCVDGLELVRRIRGRQTPIPVVLITSHGSEATAVEALKSGAACYTPKSLLSQDLTRTVERVLQISDRVQRQQIDAGQPFPNNLAFLLDNNLELIGPVIENLQTALPDWSDRDRLQIGMAIDEALVNAMHHGNLEVSSQLRDVDESLYYEQIRQRRWKKPYCDRRVCVQAQFSDKHVCIQISDDGPGFDPGRVADPTTDNNVQRIGGRGLFLIRAFMSKVAHNRSGNQITMTKLRDDSGCACD
jgi:CheY-like chemotaxis protein